MEKRIVSVENENKLFFIYFDGTTHYDEDFNGNKIEKENAVYLDENLNTFVMNVDKSYSKDMLDHFLESNIPAFIGPHSPEIEQVRRVRENGKSILKEVMIPNENPNTVGIWRLSTKEEKLKYTNLLLKQNKERTSLKLVC